MTGTCPRCATQGVSPASERKHGGRAIRGYACSCGHRWAVITPAEQPEPEATVGPSGPACPTPTKHRYATPHAARLAAERTQVPFGRRLNQYQCRCGWIHNTHLASPERYAVQPEAS
jgi:hypothetical protein